MSPSHAILAEEQIRSQGSKAVSRRGISTLKECTAHSDDDQDYMKAPHSAQTPIKGDLTMKLLTLATQTLHEEGFPKKALTNDEDTIELTPKLKKETVNGGSVPLDGGALGTFFHEG